MIGIYKITNTITGDSYVGQSVNIKRRFMEHKTPKGPNTPLKAAIKEYGVDKFSFEILEECGKEALDEKEIYWIAKLKPSYNRCEGGSGCTGHVVTDELRKRLSEKNKEYWASLPEKEKEEICKRLTGPAKGHVVSDETKQKLRSANLGKKQSKETIQKRAVTIKQRKLNGYVRVNGKHKKKVICIETNQVFNSVKETAEHFSVHPSGITACLKGRQQTCKGKHFDYVV